MSFSTQNMQLLNSTVNELPIQKLSLLSAPSLPKSTNFLVLAKAKTVFSTYIYKSSGQLFSRLQNSESIQQYLVVETDFFTEIGNSNVSPIAHIQIKEALEEISASVPFLAFYRRFN